MLVYIQFQTLMKKIEYLNDQTAYLVDLLQKEIEPNDLVNNE